MNPSLASAIEIEAETNFAEDVATFATYRLPIVGPVDCSGLKKAKIPNARTTQHRNSGSRYIDGTYSGSFTTRFHWFGHGTSTTGATTANAHETLLGNIIGNVAASIATGTTFTGGTAGVPTTAVTNGFVAGSIGFAGTLDDGRGNGQAFVVGGHATNNLTLLTELDAAPSAADLCRSAVVFYPSESPTDTDVTTYRMRLLTANLRYECHGCHPTSWSVGGLNAGETPYIEVVWSVAWFEESTGTFPSTVATNTSNPSVVAGGSVFVQLVGTDDRQTFDVRNFAVEHSLGMRTDRGPGGVKPHQDIIACRRMNDTVKVSFTIDADAATTSPVLKALFEGGPLHVLWTGSTTNGSSVAIYMPNVEPCGEYPVQRIDDNVNRYTFEGMAFTGPTTTTDLTASCIRYANG